MFAGRSWSEWLHQYAQSHQHPINQWCHMFGIPMIAVALAFFGAAVFVPKLWIAGLVLFLGGWTLQFVGHWFEGKPPEFLNDWRFLFVGLRWWFSKVLRRS